MKQCLPTMISFIEKPFNIWAPYQRRETKIKLAVMSCFDFLIPITAGSIFACLHREAQTLKGSMNIVVGT